MWNDAIDLRDFYRSPIGQTAQRILRRRIRSIWPDTLGLSILGVGFATPFLTPLRGDAERVMAVMPAGQGVLRWPAENGSLTTLSDELDLPFPDLSIDRVLLVHAVECAEQVRPLLREIWRVLAGNGRLLVVAPNRRGLWARLDRTPFGHGTPYSADQLTRLLRETLYMPLQSQHALFVPPTRWRVLLRAAPAWEAIGHSWFSGFGGLVLTEAAKQIYAAPVEATPQRRRVYEPVPNRTGQARS
jgi:SAM-dependent methyltransferase